MGRELEILNYINIWRWHENIHNILWVEKDKEHRFKQYSGWKKGMPVSGIFPWSEQKLLGCHWYIEFICRVIHGEPIYSDRANSLTAGINESYTTERNVSGEEGERGIDTQRERDTDRQSTHYMSSIYIIALIRSSWNAAMLNVSPVVLILVLYIATCQEISMTVLAKISKFK